MYLWTKTRGDQIISQGDRELFAVWLATYTKDLGVERGVEEGLRKILLGWKFDDSDEDAALLEDYVCKNINREVWVSIKARFRRYKYRAKHSFVQIQIRSTTRLKLTEYMEENNISTYDEAVLFFVSN